jgi:hypothetical protein
VRQLAAALAYVRSVSSVELLHDREKSGAKTPHSKALRAKTSNSRNEATMLMKTKELDLGQTRTLCSTPKIQGEVSEPSRTTEVCREAGGRNPLPRPAGRLNASLIDLRPSFSIS